MYAIVKLTKIRSLTANKKILLANNTRLTTFFITHTFSDTPLKYTS